MVGFQKSKWSRAETLEFTVNLKAETKEAWDDVRAEHSYVKDIPPPGLSEHEWRTVRLEQSPWPQRPSANTGFGMRIGWLIPSVRADHWWVLHAGSGDQAMREALDAILAFGLPALRRYMREGVWDDGVGSRPF
jgi:hypothetical protein